MKAHSTVPGGSQRRFWLVSITQEPRKGEVHFANLMPLRKKEQI